MQKIIALVALAAGIGACASGGPHHEEHAAEAAGPAVRADARPPPTNPVQVEMRLLEAALMDAVRAFAEGDLRPIAQSLHEVHGARENTEKAIHDGSYAPPKNPEQIETFVAMDEAFHGLLVDLVRASRANDVAKASTAFGQIVGSCDGCHQLFRR